MENISKKLIPHSMKYGLILSGIIIVLQLIMYILEIDATSIAFSLIYQLLSIVLIIWIMAYASVKFRDNYLEKNISFLRCFMIGLIIGLLAAIITSLYSYVFNVFFDPEYANKILEEAVEKIDSNPSIPDADKEMIIQKITEGFSPLSQLLGAWKSVIMHSVLALIATLFVRKKEKLPETNIY